MTIHHTRPASRSHRRAFTLIELLVVISIIALLVGILLPALGAARRSAMTAVCMSNVKQMGTAMVAYANSNKQLLPAGFRTESPRRVISWQAATYSYVTGEKLDDANIRPGVDPEYLKGNAFECPQASLDTDSPSFYQISYTMNINLPGKPFKPPIPGAVTSDTNENKLYESIFSPSATLLVGEGVFPTVTWNSCGDKDPVIVGGPTGGSVFDSVTQHSGQRHGRNINVGRADLSVTSPNWLDDDITIPIPQQIVTARRGPVVTPNLFPEAVKLYWYGRLKDIPKTLPY